MAAPSQRGSNSGTWHEELRSAHLDVARVADRLERIVERLVGPSASFRKEEDAVASNGAIFDQVLQRSKGIQSAKARIETALDNLEAMLPPEVEGQQVVGEQTS